MNNKIKKNQPIKKSSTSKQLTGKSILKSTAGLKRAVISQLPTEGDTFMIEEHPPIPTRGATPEKMELYAKLQRTIPNVKSGQAFLVPAEMKNSIHRFLKNQYENDRYIFTSISGNPKMLRVYRTILGK